MEQVDNLQQARRLITQLRSEVHQIKGQLAESEDATNRWRINYFDMQERVRKLEEALKKCKPPAE